MLTRVTDFLRQPAVVAGAAVLVLRLLTLASRFLLSLLLARMLTAAELGQYGLVTAFLAFALLGVGLEFYSHTLRQMVPAGPSKRVRIIADQILLAGSMLGVTAGLIAIAAALDLLSVKVAVWFLILLTTEHFSLEGTRILIIVSRPVRAYISLFLRGGIWVFVIAFAMLAEPSLRTIETVLMWWALGGTASVVFTAVSLSHLPWRALRNYRPDWTWIGNGLRIARPFMLTAVGALTLSYFDRFLIDRYLGRDAVGIYTFYSTIAIGILSLGASISHQFLPKVIAGFVDGTTVFRRVLMAYGYSLFAIGLLVVVAAAVAISPTVTMLSLDTYAVGIPVFYVMLAGVLLRVFADVPSYALYAAHDDMKLLACNLGAAVVSIVLTLILMPPLGLMGAACANAAASLTLLLTLGAFAWRRVHALERRDGSPANVTPMRDVFLP